MTLRNSQTDLTDLASLRPFLHSVERIKWFSILILIVVGVSEVLAHLGRGVVVDNGGDDDDRNDDGFRSSFFLFCI